MNFLEKAMTHVLTSQHEEIIEQILDMSGLPEEILEEIVELLHDTMPGWNWVGIYFLSKSQLVLGPFRGKPTEHTTIKVGSGVCGTAIEKNTNVIIDDVSKCDNYLACSQETRSEIVVLIRHQGQVVAQFDVDSNLPEHFTPQDEQFLMEVAELAAPYCHNLIGKL